MLEVLENLANYIGNTPLMNLKTDKGTLFAKLEYTNFSGSSKDRGAYSMIYQAILSKKIDNNTTIVASSSGNLAIAIASICKLLSLKFIPVIDPNINPDYESLLDMLCYKVVKVQTLDITGGYLLTRIEMVDRLCKEIENSFCADQYNDPNNYKGYYKLAYEILSSIENISHVFIPVSSGGAITGVSQVLKKENSVVKIIGIDVKGSVIFGSPPARRFISGIGSSKVPKILNDAIIDDVIHISQIDIITGCNMLLHEQGIFAGASSGAVYYGSKKFMEEQSYNCNSVLIFPDRGLAYLDTIYNKKWADNLKSQLIEE